MGNRKTSLKNEPGDDVILNDRNSEGSYFESMATMVAEAERSFNLRQLFGVIFSKLHPLFSIDCAALVVYDREKQHITQAYLSEKDSSTLPSCIETVSDPMSLSLVTKIISGFEFPVLKSRQDWIADFGENHCLLNHPTDYQFHCYIPLESEGNILGTLELHNHDRELTSEALAFCCNIADFLAGLLTSMDAAQEAVYSDQKYPVVEDKFGLRDRIMEYSTFPLTLLLESLSQVNNFDGLFLAVEECYREFLNADLIEVYLVKSELEPLDLPFELDLRAIESRLLTMEDLGKLGPKEELISLLKDLKIKQVLTLPFVHNEVVSGLIIAAFKKEFNLSVICANELQTANYQVITALDRLRDKDVINKLLVKLTEYSEQANEFIAYKQPETLETLFHDGIIGNSPQMQQVFRLLDRISSSDTTALILGETGTGKELIAKAIHDASDRARNKLIKVNCAAIPANLIESELFGHEKGSFTGATERRIGKFEQADNGTIFLDEVGELPIDLQVKLLRVLQEREFERVGGKVTIPVNVRVISATNRNLLEEVENGRFRQDLFYRLNVFPILLPPLRERKQDIPAMAMYFISKLAKRTNRKVEGFSRKAIASMMAYSWPGNVRELEHLIERHVVLCTDILIREIEIPSDQESSLSNQVPGLPVKTIFENEREHIYSVLKLCNGKISGPNGAAKMLGVPATTLNSKIKKLGLAKQHNFK